MVEAMTRGLLPHNPAPPERALLIEGWRGVRHSIALINQYQMLNLLRIDGLKLYHHDLPWNRDLPWNGSRQNAGLVAEDHQRIMDVPDADDRPVDAVYRIASVIRAGAADDRRKTATFMITEVGLSAACFPGESLGSDFFTRDENFIVTSSSWSRDRIVDYGFEPEKVHIVPCGVDTSVFHPSSAEERKISRSNLGIAEDDIVFINIGGAFGVKGLDLLLRAFAIVRAKGRRVRLILKDLREIYGTTLDNILSSVAQTCPELTNPETMAAISVIPGHLDRTQLRLLFGIGDAYVSAYRAEGFNLPVLEAIACGIPVIVPRGGATDDFCNDDVAWRIAAKQGAYQSPTTGIVQRYIDPNLDDLIAAMTAVADGRRHDPKRYALARDSVLRNFSWARAANDLARLTVGLSREDQPAPVEERASRAAWAEQRPPLHPQNVAA